MSDTEIYKNLRISGSKRIEFIRSLSGKDLDRAYEINKEMFQAAMDGLIGDVDKSIVMGKIIKFLVTMFQLLSSCIG